MFSIILTSLQFQTIHFSHPSTRHSDCSCLVICHRYNPANSIYSCLSLPFFVPHKYSVSKSSIDYSLVPFLFLLTPIISSVFSIVSGKLFLDANVQLCNNLFVSRLLFYQLCILHLAQQGAPRLKHSDTSVIKIINNKRAG